MIQSAKISEISEILKVTKACAADMIEKGICQWNEHYPNRNSFEKDIEREELYTLKHNHQIIGAIVISTLMDDEYKPIDWLTINENNIYIHRLCVHPKFQGKGYAQQLMSFAENYARDRSYTSVRLDTFSQNKRNMAFYKKRGYQQLGDIYFPKQSEHPFPCYELVL